MSPHTCSRLESSPPGCLAHPLRGLWVSNPSTRRARSAPWSRGEGLVVRGLPACDYFPNTRVLTPSPVPPRLMTAPVAVHPLPQRGEGSRFKLPLPSPLWGRGAGGEGVELGPVRLTHAQSQTIQSGPAGGCTALCLLPADPGFTPTPCGAAAFPLRPPPASLASILRLLYLSTGKLPRGYSLWMRTKGREGVEPYPNWKTRVGAVWLATCNAVRSPPVRSARACSAVRRAISG